MSEIKRCETCGHRIRDGKRGRHRTVERPENVTQKELNRIYHERYLDKKTKNRLVKEED